MGGILGQKSTPTFIAIPVVEFSREEYKIRKVLGKKATVVK